MGPPCLPGSFIMEKMPPGHELHHELFGSVIDRTEMAPYLLLRVGRYVDAISQATKMMGNRGFDTSGSSELQESEKKEVPWVFCGDFPE